jgi:antitoxin component of MazEF toxin-antitoxin module
MIRKLIGLGKYSAVVSLPRGFLEKLHWRKGQKLKVTQSGRKIEIQDHPNK